MRQTSGPGGPVLPRLRYALHAGRLFRVPPAERPRVRDVTFTAAEWAAFAAAIEGRYPDRWAAARAITGKWAARNGWDTAPAQGTIPADITAALAAVRAAPATVHRQLAFTGREWDALTAAAGAAGVSRSALLRAIIRTWIPARAWKAAADRADRPAGVSRQAAAILRELLADPGRPRHGSGIARAAGIPRPTVYQVLRRFEQQGWLEAGQEAENPRGRGTPPRTLYKFTPDGLAAAGDLLGTDGG